MIQRTIRLLFLGLALVPPLAHAQGVVLPRERRTGILEQCAATLAMTDPAMGARLRASQSMFQARPQAVAAPLGTAPASTGQDVPPPPPERLTDEQALEMIARLFTPSGSMMLGDRAAVLFSDGRRMFRGETFTARIRDDTYPTELIEVTATTYTLRVGTATVTRNFSDQPRQRP
jgi:hypothetical protein